MGEHEHAWWRNAVVYQLYVRSFADGNGDGIGDLAGVRRHLGHLRDLGVDAIWFNPWYASPMVDGGYDVADYRAIEPTFGTLAEAEALIDEARALGIRTIVDIVPNHVSARHPWFTAALAAGPGSTRCGSASGSGPAPVPTATSRPTGGPRSSAAAWCGPARRTPTARPASGTSTCSRRTSPTSTGTTPTSGASTRTSCASGSTAAWPGCASTPPRSSSRTPTCPRSIPTTAPGEHPFIDRDELHDVYRSWRALADTYDEPRVLIGEIWMEDTERFARYLRPDELHSAFNFDFLTCPWEPDALRRSIETTLALHAPGGATPTWVLSNHDITRVATRYGRADTSFAFAAKRMGTPTDAALGRRRARAAALLGLALPGSFYVYQGDELGLPEVDLPVERIQDPMHFQSGGTDPGREGCRVPLPWSGPAPPYGFSPERRVGRAVAAPTRRLGALTAEAQRGAEDSMLTLYRRAIALRRLLLTPLDHDLTWCPSDPAVLAFERGDVGCVVNLSTQPIALPWSGAVLLASADLVAGALPPDAAAWVRVHPGPIRTPHHRPAPRAPTMTSSRRRSDGLPVGRSSCCRADVAAVVGVPATVRTTLQRSVRHAAGLSGAVRG